MKILVINHEYPPVGGGAATVTKELLRRLVDAGIEVALLTGENPDDSTAEADKPRFPVFRVRSGRRTVAEGSYREFVQFFIASLFVLPKIRKQFRPDVVLAFFTLPGGLTALVQKWLYRTDYIVSIRGGDIPGFEMSPALRFFHWLLRPVIRLVCLKARKVHVNSTRLRELTEKLIPGKEITLIPNGVNFPGEWFHVGWDSDEIRLLFVGRLSRQKNLSVFLKGLAKLPPEYRRACRFTIVGDGPEKNNLQELVRNFRLADRVTFAGWLPRKELTEYYLHHQVLVLPSLDEGMSNTALEAMACGCLLLSSERGALDWGDLHLSNHWVVKDSMVPERWTEILERIILHTETMREDAEIMRAYVRNTLAWETLIPRYLRLVTDANYSFRYNA